MKHVHEDDDHTSKRIPHQSLIPHQTPLIMNKLLHEVPHQNYHEPHLSQGLISNITNFVSNSNKNFKPNAFTQIHVQPTSTQSLPILFPLCKTFETFFLPSDTHLTIPIFLQAQKEDPVLFTVHTWLKYKTF